MEYIIVNITTPNDALVNKYFNLIVLKDAAYNSKTKNAMNKTMIYSYVLIPVLVENDGVKRSEAYNAAVSEYCQLLNGKIQTFVGSPSRDAIYSIGRFLEKNKTEPNFIEKLVSFNFCIDIVNTITDNDFSLFYTDGSASNKRKGGYCCVKIGDDFPKDEEESIVEPFTGKLKSYEIICGSIEDSTNNIAELTALKQVFENKTNRRFQVIISDSDYSLKCFREYIYNWRINGWKGSDKKTIKNLELIQSINNLLLTNNCIYLFKWTEGHVGNQFNELCDTIAKQYSEV